MPQLPQYQVLQFRWSGKETGTFAPELEAFLTENISPYQRIASMEWLPTGTCYIVLEARD